MINFYYDESGRMIGFYTNMTSTPGTYYYAYNLQGDVIGIVDSTGTVVVEYTYDEWGKPLTKTGTLANTIGTINPIRYRGYYYDSETGFYYCQSRYYDITGYNMFAYCGNNPVNRVDPTGQFWITSLIVTAVAVVCTVALSSCSAQPTSDVGAASPYSPSNSTDYNCHAYALGEKRGNM